MRNPSLLSRENSTYREFRLVLTTPREPAPGLKSQGLTAVSRELPLHYWYWGCSLPSLRHVPQLEPDICSGLIDLG
jgi:hypothetical protein